MSEQKKEMGAQQSTIETPKRITVQENPRIITDKELRDADDDWTKTTYKGSKKGDIFTYEDLLDNITLTNEDLKFVTGRENRKELSDRLDLLNQLIQAHRTPHIINEERERNYESGMSFSQEQKAFLKILQSDGFSTDMEKYINARNLARDYKHKKIERNSLPLHMSYLYGKTIGEAFDEMFPLKTRSVEGASTFNDGGGI